MADIIFEKAIKELEKIVESLESQEIDIDKAIKLYQKGLSLASECSKSLESARKKVDMVVKGGDKCKTEPFPEQNYES